MGQHHKATGQCQTIHPTKSEATRKQAAPNSVPQSPISGCGGCLTGLQCLRKLQYMPQQEDILHEEQTAHSQVTPEKQFPGFHFSITSVTVPFTTASTSVFTTSAADAVTKQRFSHPLLSFQEIKLFPFLRTLSSSSPGFTQLFSRWCNSFKSISTVPLKKTEKSFYFKPTNLKKTSHFKRNLTIQKQRQKAIRAVNLQACVVKRFVPKFVFFSNRKMFWERHILTRPQTEALIPTGVLLEKYFKCRETG